MLKRIFSALVFGAALGLAASPSPAEQTPPSGGSARFDVVEKSIVELQNALTDGRVTSRQLVEQYLARIKQYDQSGPKLNAFITVNPHALEDAAALDAERRAGRLRGTLHGIPIVIKDNYATSDMPTTGGSKALAVFETRRDAFMIRKLRDAGAIFIGKTNLHELAYGITSISSMGGQTLNPYDPARNPGGSSGGTGAAVAASFGAAGMGTDTCGSIRNPASSNNLFGLRGTLGLSSRDGIIPLSHTQDIGGPLARTVTDLAVMLDATVGPDPTDPLTSRSNGRIPRSYLSSIGDRSLADITIGIVPALFGAAPEDEEVALIVERAIEDMEALGAHVSEISIPAYEEVMQGTSVINAEFKFDLMDFLSRYPGAPMKNLDEIVASGKYDRAVENVLKRANAVESRDSETYRSALARRELATTAVVEAMRGVTVLAYPTLRRKPAVVGQAQGGSNCQLSATTGLPAISIPAGFTADGLPVGLELLGSAFSESTLLRIAYAYETQYSPRRAPKHTP
jgi:Asp-tRNA(Asn)/Glu-tRNA(Gln) amidotransferase A subunit family amidase